MLDEDDDDGMVKELSMCVFDCCIEICDFSISASKSIIKFPIPVKKIKLIKIDLHGKLCQANLPISHSLSSYSKLVSLISVE